MGLQKADTISLGNGWSKCNPKVTSALDKQRDKNASASQHQHRDSLGFTVQMA